MNTINFNDAEEMYKQAMRFYTGDGAPINETKAAELFLEAAKQGYPAAQNSLGICYVKGRGVEQNYSKAATWFSKAAEHGIQYAKMELQRLARLGYEPEPEEETEFAEPEAEEKSSLETAKKYYTSGMKYYDGKTMAKNYTEAVKCFRKAAEIGHAEAQYRLGVCYGNGQGVEKNLSEKVYWYKKSAAQGYAIAQIALGICYQYGDGVQRNEREAAKFYRLASDQGNRLQRHSSDTAMNLEKVWSVMKRKLKNYIALLLILTEMHNITSEICIIWRTATGEILPRLQNGSAKLLNRDMKRLSLGWELYIQ